MGRFSRALIGAAFLLCAFGESAGAQSARQAILSPAPVTYDAAAQAYFDRLKADGCQAPTRQAKATWNTFVVAEKASGNWTQDAAYLLASGEACSARINVRQPSLYAVTFTGGYSLSATAGFNSDATSGYGDTGVNQSALGFMGQNNAHVGAWALAKGNFQLGIAGSSSGLQMSPGGATKATRLTSATAVNDTSLPGYNWADRTTAATIVTGNNGNVQTAAGASTSAALLASHILIGKANTSFMPVGTNLVWIEFGPAMADESAHYVHLRALLQGLGVGVP